MRPEAKRLREERRRERQLIQEGSPEPLELRQEQEMTVEAVLQDIREGRVRMCVEAPTGSGKTVMMMAIIDKLWAAGNHSQEPTADRDRGQVLILVPSIQIASQVKEQAERILRTQLRNRRTIDLEQGDWRSDSLADLFLKVLHHFNDEVTLREDTVPIDGFRNGHKVKLLGSSATPDRSDDFDVEDAFPRRTYTMDIEPLIDFGKLLYAEVKYLLDVEKLIKNPGEGDMKEQEYNEKDKDPFNECNLAIVKQHKTRSELGRRFTLVFCTRLLQVWSLKTAFTNAGVTSEAITGKTLRERRNSLLRDFKDGQFPVLINCGTLVEGTDLPCVGRGMRISLETGKLNCLILDYTVTRRTGMHIFPKLYKLVRVVSSTPAIDRTPQNDAEDNSETNSDDMSDGDSVADPFETPEAPDITELDDTESDGGEDGAGSAHENEAGLMKDEEIDELDSSDEED